METALRTLLTLLLALCALALALLFATRALKRLARRFLGRGSVRLTTGAMP